VLEDNTSLYNPRVQQQVEQTSSIAGDRFWAEVTGAPSLSPFFIQAFSKGRNNCQQPEIHLAPEGALLPRRAKRKSEGGLSLVQVITCNYPLPNHCGQRDGMIWLERPELWAHWCGRGRVSSSHTTQFLSRKSPRVSSVYLEDPYKRQSCGGVGCWGTVETETSYFFIEANIFHGLNMQTRSVACVCIFPKLSDLDSVAWPWQAGQDFVAPDEQAQYRVEKPIWMGSQEVRGKPDLRENSGLQREGGSDKPCLTDSVSKRGRQCLSVPVLDCSGHTLGQEQPVAQGKARLDTKYSRSEQQGRRSWLPGVEHLQH
jgi:hypothetical protein